MVRCSIFLASIFYADLLIYCVCGVCVYVCVCTCARTRARTCMYAHVKRSEDNVCTLTLSFYSGFRDLTQVLMLGDKTNS